MSITHCGRSTVTNLKVMIMTEISFKLSTKDISRAIRELKDYKKSLQVKCNTFAARLADVGILFAENNSGEYGHYITFGKKVDDTRYGAVALMYGTSGTITRQWLLSDGSIAQADISPILMAEFGSGHFASDAANLPNAKIANELGMGQGTFPGQTHAFDPEGWYWMDLSGEWHTSMGEHATMPMFKAAMEMETQIFQIAREVFGT